MPNLYYVQVKSKFEEISKERMEPIGEFINIFDSTYLLYTDKSAKEIYEIISIDNESSIFVVKCNINEYYGRANKKVWEWIAEKKKLIR